MKKPDSDDMNNELQPTPDQEVLSPPRKRGWNLHRRPGGVKNAIQRQTRDEAMAYLGERGPQANPLLRLLHLAEHAKSEAVQEKAANDACKYLIPAQALIESVPDDDSDSPGAVQVVDALLGLLHPPQGQPRLIAPETTEPRS